MAFLVILLVANAVAALGGVGLGLACAGGALSHWRRGEVGMACVGAFVALGLVTCGGTVLWHLGLMAVVLVAPPG